MKSIKSNFEKISKNNPHLGSYCVLSKAVDGKKFSRQAIRRAYNKFIPKDEYLKSESKYHFDHLCSVSKTPEGNVKEGKNRFKHGSNSKDDTSISEPRNMTFFN